MAGTVGMMRVRNEARWIERSVSSLLPVCDRVIVLDDHSTDDTAALAASLGAQVFDSPFTALDETRDKNYLLSRAELLQPDWIICIDGDEVLAPGAAAPLCTAMARPARCFTLPVLYLWDDEQHYRTDGVYGRFRRDSVFRPNGSRFTGTGNGGNFHCGNVPLAARAGSQPLDAPLLHYGYLHRQDRIRKFNWYNSIDKRNMAEDCYRHMVVGDLYPADSRFMYGGPLEVRTL